MKCKTRHCQNQDVVTSNLKKKTNSGLRYNGSQRLALKNSQNQVHKEKEGDNNHLIYDSEDVLVDLDDKSSNSSNGSIVLVYPISSEEII